MTNSDNYARARDPECAACLRIQRAMRLDPSDRRGRVCPDPACGTEYVYGASAPLVAPRTRAPSGIPRESVRVSAFVRDLLALHVATVRAEGTTTSGRFVVRLGESSTAGAMRAIETGIVGTGCKGTRGAWGGGPQEPRELPPVLVDAASERRYTALRGEARETAEAIVADAQGDRVAPLDVGGKMHELTLDQRVALRVVDPLTMRRWLKHARVRDTGPMLLGSAELGARRLREAAESWWAA